MASKLDADPLVAALVAEGNDAEKARAFVTEIMRKAAGYKPTGVSTHVMRKHLLDIAKHFQSAIESIDRASDETVHWDSTSYLSTYATLKAVPKHALTPSGIWDSTIRKLRPPDSVPLLPTLRAYMQVYSDTALAIADRFGHSGKGRPADFERFRPVLFCAEAWVRAFGRKPGTGETSPFVRACRVVLPLFGWQVPHKLHEHVRTALRAINVNDLMMRLGPVK